MWEIILTAACIASVVLAVVMYARTSRILSGVEKMLDDAIDGTFTEENFTEGRLSRLEARMYRYLSAERVALSQTHAEHDSIKTLISDISHQTKTPVANILLYTQLLKEASGQGGPPKELVAQIEEQTEKLRFLLDALIKASRLENGIVQVVPRKNSVRALIEALDFAGAAGRRGVRFFVEDGPDIDAVFDFKWTLEALSNIVDNAVKYTPAGGTITVRVKVYEMFVCIDVADEGIGISEEESAKIFTRFYRSPRVYDEKGAGIGLYVAREIVRQQGGYIRVRSAVGEGAVFSVFLQR